MNIISRLGKLEKELGHQDQQKIYIIGYPNSFVGSEQDLTPEELEQVRRTGNMFVFRDGVEELAE